MNQKGQFDIYGIKNNKSKGFAFNQVNNINIFKNRPLIHTDVGTYKYAQYLWEFDIWLSQFGFLRTSNSDIVNLYNIADINESNNCVYFKSGGSAGVTDFELLYKFLSKLK